MEEVKFPQYERSQKRSVKLSIEDIAEMRQMYASGVVIAEIARQFKVSQSGAKYQLLTDEQREAQNEKRNSYKRTYNPEVHRRYLDNKKSVQKEEVLAYRRKINAESKARNIEKTRNRDKQWHKDNRKSRAKEQI